jgi:hypothetical protein
MVSLNFPKLFTDLIDKHVLQLMKDGAPRPPRRGRPAGFIETNLQNLLNDLSKEESIHTDGGCPPIIINRTLPGGGKTRPDYSFVRCVPPVTPDDVLATCEVKGPVRRAFFDVERLHRSWGARIVADVEGQLERTALYPNASHYVALLVPCRVEWTNNAQIDHVLRCIEGRVPGAGLKESLSASVMLPNGVPLDIVLVGVKRTENMQNCSGNGAGDPPALPHLPASGSACPHRC